MRFLKVYWEVIVFIPILAAVDYGIARAACAWLEWPAYMSMPMTIFAVAALFLWGTGSGFHTLDLFTRTVSVKKKIGGGIAMLVGVTYACMLLKPHVYSLADAAGLLYSILFIVFVTKWCANSVNIFVGFWLSAISFKNWMRVNREGLTGLRRYTV